MTDPTEAAVNAADPDEDEDVGAQDGVVEPGLPAGDDPGDNDPDDDEVVADPEAIEG